MSANHKLKILYSHFLADENHPAVQMVQAISRQLRALGHEVLVHRSLGPVQDVEDRPKTARPHQSHRFASIKNRLWFAKALARNHRMLRRDREAIAAFQPDIILAREDAYCVSIVQAARSSKVPIVTYADVPVAYETRMFHSAKRWHPPFVVEAIERWWLKQSQAVITPSHPAAEQLKKYGLAVPIHVSANGVNPESFPATNLEQKRRARLALGLPSNATIIGFQGSFRTFHGIDLLRDMILATAARHDVHWLLIGDGPERSELQKDIAGRSQATFLGLQPPGRMGDLTSLFDIAVSTHTFIEGSFYFCPLKILEYAAAGCAVLASAQGDIPRLLDAGRVGIVIDNPAPTAWIAALIELLDNPQRVGELGRCARDFVLGEFTWRHSAERIEGILRDALHAPVLDRGGLLLDVRSA